MRFLRACACVVIAACGGDIGPGGSGPDGATAAADAYQLCIDKTNTLRASVGKPAVARSAALETYSNASAMYDFNNPSPPHAHFQMTNGGGISFAENECPHWDLSFGNGNEAMLVSACIDAFWSEGPGGGHYDNMTGPYASLGCGIYHVGTDYTIDQDFGH
jgi:hypothetical protein